ncbi:MAG: PilC/PilY family type IV pilus protein, partial [Venatoribacter sp.]
MKKLRPLVFSFLLLSVSANAQDTEIYMRTSLQPPKPNVVFIIDTSTSMERLAKFSLLPISIKSRIYMVKEALKSAINDAQGINIALMKLNRFENAKSKCEAPSVGYVLVNGCHSGGKFITPMLDVDLPGNKQRLINAIDTKATTTKGLSPQVGLRIVANYTPIVEATHEAMRFYRGETVKYGLYHKVKPYLLDVFGLFSMQDEGLQLLSDSATIDNTTLPLSINSKYQSPITDQCQRNHIVLFTDGASTFDRESDAEINTMLDNLGRANLPTELQTRCQTYNSWNEFQSKQSCLNDLAYVLYNTDNSPQFSGKQRIQFHALAGFFSIDNVLTSFADMVDALDILDIGLAHPIYNAAEDSFAAHAKRNLRKAAQYGNGFYATPNTFEEIKTAINTTFQEIIDTSATFAAPTIPANIFDNIGFFDQVYYPVFKARGNAGWSGNLKRYQMTAAGLQDANGNLALDAQGDFKDSTQSFWSQEVDGKNALLGGLASRLATPRPIVSNLSSGDLNNDSANQITTSNHLLTATALGAEGYDDDSLLELKKWLAGYDVKGGNESQPRFELEDALHTTPVILNYGKTQDSQGHEIADSTIFFGSNSGFLHAFDTHIDHPKERFSFIPKELLPIATKYYEGIGGKHYGLDGPISVWHDDQNQDRIVNNGERAILFVGMRRGGHNYYAIDVSNRDKPKLLWQINGGTTGYSRLGQTWSKAVVSQIKWPNAQSQAAARKVVIFAGGYDAAEDDYNTRTSHNMGNAIYMVDALTGQLLWRASNEATAELHLPQMTSSIVGNVAVVDDNEDGYADLLYFADLGGR